MEHLLNLPPDGSAHGPGIDQLIGLLHWLMILLFIGWGIFFVYTLIRFRRARQRSANYTGVKSHFSNYVEVGVLAAEVVLLVGFSIPMWSKRVDAFPAEKDATVVRVVAEQFAWNVHYAGRDGKFGRTAIELIDTENPLGLDRNDPDAKDDITTINQLNLPVDKPVIVHLSTKDVIHSFTLPMYRVKQDAVPGMSIPLWFTPTKTTDQIREEMVSRFSVTDAMKRTRTVSLPQTQKVGVGASLERNILMQDAIDKSGSVVLPKGKLLTGDDVRTLTNAGISEATIRPPAGLDGYVSMEEYKNAGGEIVVTKNEFLMEDAVTKLIDAHVREVHVRDASNLDPFVSMETVNDASGSPIVSKSEMLTEETVSKLADIGRNELAIAPSTPTEIACAQLCGLGHYRMRGYVTVQTQEEFQKWFDEQEATLTTASAE